MRFAIICLMFLGAAAAHAEGGAITAYVGDAVGVKGNIVCPSAEAISLVARKYYEPEDEAAFKAGIDDTIDIMEQHLCWLYNGADPAFVIAAEPLLQEENRDGNGYTVVIPAVKAGTNEEFWLSMQLSSRVEILSLEEKALFGDLTVEEVEELRALEAEVDRTMESFSKRWGAISYVIGPTSVITGVAEGYPSSREAEDAAAENCRENGGSNCEAFAFNTGCVFVAWSRGPEGTRGVAFGRSPIEANAIKICKDGGGVNCVVTEALCLPTSP